MSFPISMGERILYLDPGLEALHVTKYAIAPLLSDWFPDRQSEG